MSKTALTNKVALASTGDKLKHWTQAIRDLYTEFLELKGSVVPEYHASPTKQYGLGDSFRYGHLRLLDKLLYQFKQNEDGTWWTQSTLPLVDGYGWNAVTWHAGLFIAVGTNGRIVTSKDGKTWDNIHWIERPNTDPDYEFFDVKWCGSMFIAVGSYNSFVYSYDGTYWHSPMYVGSIYNESGVMVPANVENLTVRPAAFRATDAWRSIAYDKRTGAIVLCGTQCRTITCRHMPTDTISTILFGETIFHKDGDAKDTYILKSVAAKELPEENRTIFVAVGNWNSIVQGSIQWNTLNPLVLDWPRDEQSNAILGPLTIEDNIHTIAAGTISDETGWNNITVNVGPDGKEYFVAIGTSGQSVMSLTGIADSWNVPVYEDASITTAFNCQVHGWNLFVVAGDWKEASQPNITMYNDSVYTDPQDIEHGSSVTAIQHFNTAVDMISWNGAAYGDETFVIVGSKNAIYWAKLEESDTSGCALGIEFYKEYVVQLEERIRKLEAKMIINDMAYIDVQDETLTFMWNDPLAKMYRTRGEINLNFLSAPQYIYKEMTVYLEAVEDTTLKLVGCAEWENDLLEPEWGKEGSHLTLKAIFIGSRVIVHIIDNDQLADNLIDLLAEDQQP